MPEEIQKFDPSTLMQGVKDRIKATFVSLIPDDQWDSMVQKEIASFFDPSTKLSRKFVLSRQGWGSDGDKSFEFTGEVSPFQAIILEMCITTAIDKIKAHITTGVLDQVFDFDKAQANEELVGIVERAVPLAMKRFFESFAFMQMSNLRSEILNHRV